VKRYAITRHSSVEFDLEKIQDFLAPVAGVKVAANITGRIRTRISALQVLPHVGTLHTEPLLGLRAIPAADKAVICFTVDDDARIVKIICVAYAGQDWQAIAGNRGEA